MNTSNYSGKFARTMAQINPYMSGPVMPMADIRSGNLRGLLLAVGIGLALAGVLMTWAMQ